MSAVGSVLLNFFVALTTAGSGVLLLKRRRLATGVHSVSGSAFTVSDSGRVEDDFVPLEDDPPVRSVSPVSPIVGLASASVVYHVGPDRVHPMAALSHVSAKKHQHVDSEEVCGQFVQCLSDNNVCTPEPPSHPLLPLYIVLF